MEDINQSGKIQIIWHSIFSFASKAITYVLLIVFANLYLPEDYGKARFIMSIFLLATAFIYFGLPQSLVPFYVKYKNKISTIFYFYLVTISFFILTSLFFFHDSASTILLLFSIFFYFLFLFFLGIYQSHHQHGIYQFLQTLVQAVTLVLALFFANLGVEGILISFAASFIILGASVTAFNYKELIFFLKPDLDLAFLWKYLSFSFVSIVMGYSFLFLSWIDSSVLGILSSYENVAIYNISSPLAMLITIIPLSISMFFLTRVSLEKDKELSRSILKRVLRISLSISLISSIILVSLIYPITKIFFPAYSGNSELTFMILLIGIQFYCAYYLIYIYYIGNLTPNKALFPILSAALINAALDFILISKFGVIGVAIATLIAHAACFTMLMHKINLLKLFWPAYLLSLAIPLAFYMKHYGVVLLIIVLPLLFAFKLIEKEDIKAIVDNIHHFLEQLRPIH